MSLFAWLRPSAPELDHATRQRLARLPKPAPLGVCTLREQRWVVLDLETSGLNTNRDQVLSIGAVAIEDGAIDFAQQFERTLYRPTQKTNASVLDSDVTATGTGTDQGAITVAADYDASIDALVAAAAVSAAISGSGSTPAVGIGFSIARNLIGWREYDGKDAIEVQATVADTDGDGDTRLTAAQGVSVTALSHSDIDATVAAAAVALAMSTSSSLAATAAGVFSDNRMAADVHATITGATQVDTGTGALTVTADDTSTINAEALACMKPHGLFINIARGDVVDEAALAKALQARQIAGAGLDVYEQEADLFFENLSEQVIDDEVFKRLLTFPNVLITGHQAFFTKEALQEISQVTSDNLLAFAGNTATGNELVN